VYAGTKRIARVTGTIDKEAQRVQRLMLYPGWNLAASAVNSDTGLNDINGISEVYQWDNLKQDWKKSVPIDPIVQGQVFWIFTETPMLLTLKGAYIEPELPADFQAGGFFGYTGLEEISIPLLPTEVSLWFFENLRKEWLMNFGKNTPFLSNTGAPKRLHAGQPVFIQNGGPGSITFGSNSAKILYYHKDHLGSSSIITDITGAVHSEENYYPLGESRVVNNKGLPNIFYKFTDQEQDPEIGLYNYDARLYHPVLGRFVSPDSLVPDWYDLQQLCPYSYTRNNFINYIDPTGHETTGEAIDRMGVEAAEEGNILATAGWATLSAAWTVFGAEKVSKITDNVISSRKDLTRGDYVEAGLEVAGAIGGIGKVVGKAGKLIQVVHKAGKAAKVGTKIANVARKVVGTGKKLVQSAKSWRQGRRAKKLIKQGKMPNLFSAHDRQLPDLFNLGKRSLASGEYKAAIKVTVAEANNAIAKMNLAVGEAHKTFIQTGKWMKAKGDMWSSMPSRGLMWARKAFDSAKIGLSAGS